jgi:large subunit ribosomal protein L29
MKLPKAAQYRVMTDEQLGSSLNDLEKSLFELRFQASTDRLETPSEIRETKRAIARLKTIQWERVLVKEKSTNG